VTDRYAAFLQAMVELDAIRWKLIGLAALLYAGYVAINLLQPVVRKWAEPLYVVLVLMLVYGVMIAGMLTTE